MEGEGPSPLAECRDSPSLHSRGVSTHSMTGTLLSPTWAGPHDYTVVDPLFHPSQKCEI